jgi:tetratricopeptide (TPR) repeat protein
MTYHMNTASSTSPESRLDGLPRSAIRRVTAAAQALALGRVIDAEQRLNSLIAVHPDHPEVLRLFAGLQSLRGNSQGALTIMRRAIALRPDDAAYWSSLGSALIEASRYDEAIEALRRACELDPEYTTAWYNLGLALVRCMRMDEAAIALRRAVSQSPELAINARVMLGEMFRAEGRVDEAIAEYRATIEQQAHAGKAWVGLADIKTQRFADDDLEKLRVAMRHPNASEDDLSAMGFALAKALDDRELYAESLAALEQAHARVHAHKPWDPSVYTAHIDAILEAFTPPPAGATGGLGHEAIFIVSMPRSGSTLTEQVLASHSLVDGGNEVSDLPSVLMEESKRLAMPFPEFVSALSPSDWERMGHRYLERAAGWRGSRPRFTDKLPSNWHYIGAIRAMLPGARIVIVRRDPLETCLSCYRHQLSHSEYTCTFTGLASVWRGFDRAARHWRRLHPTHVYENIYEEFVVDPQARIRELLAFCDLPFEQACLEFHKSERKVHTTSATQVREPLRRDTARAHRYGALLDPLRAALGLPPYSSDSQQQD